MVVLSYSMFSLRFFSLISRSVRSPLYLTSSKLQLFRKLLSSFAIRFFSLQNVWFSCSISEACSFFISMMRFPMLSWLSWLRAAWQEASAISCDYLSCCALLLKLSFSCLRNSISCLMSSSCFYMLVFVLRQFSVISFRALSASFILKLVVSNSYLRRLSWVLNSS